MRLQTTEVQDKFCTRYNGIKKVVTIFEKPSLTDQSFKQECDVGFIVENYIRTGKGIEPSTMNFADCTTMKDYQDAMYLVAEANSNFENLPSKDRDRFKTVENYLEFISNRANLKESYEKGYIDPSTVDLVDIYPERFQVQEESLSTPQEPVKEVSEVIPPTSEKAG